MARKGKLTPAAVRAIFKSTESALVMAKRFKVSANLVYLIRARRVHKAITARLKAPLRAERKKPMARMNIDIDRLADAILKRIVDRLRGRR